MGMTLWIHTLEGRDYSRDSDDHSLMFELTERLDQLCEDLQVQKLSEFIDYADIQQDMDDDPEDEEFESMLDPETDLPYGIDDMAWFDAASGLASVLALRDYLSDNPLADLEFDDQSYLLEELDDCISILEGPASRLGKFHFSLVE